MGDLIGELKSKLKQNKYNNNSKWRIIFSFDVLPRINTYRNSNYFLEAINNFNKDKLVEVKMENKKFQMFLNQEIKDFKKSNLRSISVYQKVQEEIKTYDKSILRPTNTNNNEGWLSYFISFIY